MSVTAVIAALFWFVALYSSDGRKITRRAVCSSGTSSEDAGQIWMPANGASLRRERSLVSISYSTSEDDTCVARSSAVFLSVGRLSYQNLSPDGLVYKNESELRSVFKASLKTAMFSPGWTTPRRIRELSTPRVACSRLVGAEPSIMVLATRRAARCLPYLAFLSVL